jgi:hypothetical protein
VAHADYEPKVAKAFDAKWPTAGLSRAHTLDFHVKIAQRLFNAESDNVKEQIRAKAAAAHKASLAMHVVGFGDHLYYFHVLWAFWNLDTGAPRVTDLFASPNAETDTCRQ